MNPRTLSFPVFLVSLAGLFLSSSAGVAQKAVIAPNPLAPTLAMPLPAGVQRGTAIDLNLTGTNLADAVGLWTDIPGAKVTIPTDMNNGKEAAKLRVKLEVPKETPLGFYGLRVATKRGVSNLRLFAVDDLPIVPEAGNNNAKAMAQAVTVPTVVAGRIDAETSDFFKFTAKAGQRISFEVLGHRLGSAFDPQITLYDAKTERELPGGHDNDARGLQTDPRLTYTFKQAGDFVVEVRDTTFRGGADFAYLLRIGDFPCATSPLPMALKRGVKAPIQFAGTMVEGVAPVEVTAPADPNVEVVWVTPRSAAGLAGWPVALAISDLDEVVEAEPNNEPAKATRVPVPGALTGRIQERNDVDTYVFKATKGQRLILEAQTYELYSPAEVYLVLKNDKGMELGKTDPTKAPRIDFNPQVDGDVFLHVEHLHHSYYGGPTEAYRVRIVPFANDFSLNAGIDRYDVPQGGVAVVTVNVVRAGYTGPIELSVAGSATVSGTSVVPAGAVAALLPIIAKPDAPLGPQVITVQGKATVDTKPVVRSTNVSGTLATSLGGLVHPPLQFVEKIAVGVTEKPPFTLALRFEPPEVLRGGTVSVVVVAARDAGFTEDIVLAPLGLPANVAPVLKNIAKNTNEIKVELKPAANAALGSFPITFTGKAKFQNRDYVVTALPGPLVVAPPFELTVEPATLMLAPGAKMNLKVTAVRKGGYQGPITLDLRNLPANVIASKPMIAMGQNAVDIEVTAAPTAVPATKADVHVFGTATAAGNQTNQTANFTVGVVKK